MTAEVSAVANALHVAAAGGSLDYIAVTFFNSK
jgi:hypothetical protein